MAEVGIEDSVVRAAALVPVPWANGGGVTRVIADRPQFRLSLATIAGEGPFSIFPGFERHIALVSGKVAFQPYALVIDATSAPMTFPGADSVHAFPLGGPALALNLMVPTGAPALRLERSEGGVLTDTIAVFACDAFDIDGTMLAPHDTLFPAGAVHLAGRALVVRPATGAISPVSVGEHRNAN